MQRIFIGVPVDEHVQHAITELLKPCRTRSPAIRWVPNQNRHMTLAFLGPRTKPEIDQLLDSCEETWQWPPSFQLCFSELQRFPNPGSRIVALTGLLNDPLESLLQTTRNLLAGNGIEIENKEFRPHITLGRARRGESAHPAIDQQTAITLTVSSVVLYQSTLTETGSIYRRLKEFELAQIKASKIVPNQ